MIPAIFLWLGINAVQAQTRLSIEDKQQKQPISRKYQDRQPMPIFSKTSIWVWWVWK